MCSKRRYSRQGALFAIVRAQRTNKKQRKQAPVRSYYCKYCNSYHLTSQPRFDILTGEFKGTLNRSYGRL